MPEQLQSRERQRTLWDLLRNGAGSNRPTDTSNPTLLQSVVSHHRDLKPVGLTVSRDLSCRRRQSHGRFRSWGVALVRGAVSTGPLVWQE